jgi:ubiquitin carboxyl-terminal hydrolase 4/11/15
LDKKWEKLIKNSHLNVMGTDGKMVVSWAKLISEMHHGNSNSARPSAFKKVIGQFNPTFEGYEQHDSQECINTILDFIHEDLYRKEKKPYVETGETEGKTDKEASIEAWNKHVYRNESVILDLFHGQFKSRTSCNQCDKVSIVFDPFLMI